jgi:hypothetical protein
MWRNSVPESDGYLLKRRLFVRLFGALALLTETMLREIRPHE